MGRNLGIVEKHVLARPAGIVAGCLSVLLFASGLRAQRPTDGRRIYEEELRVRLDQQIPRAREMGLDGGGWFNFAFFTFDDASEEKERTLRQYELRLWGSGSVRGVHRFYVRGLTTYDDWNGGDNITGKGDDWVEPKIERIWYQFDLGQMIQNQTGKPPRVDMKFKVGRAFADIGTAFVLSMPLDMIQFDVSCPNWDVKALLGNTIHSSRNIDDASNVYNHQDRWIWGAQATYTGLSHHRPFAYFLSNHDKTDPSPDSLSQDFEYTSQYVGVGSTGSLCLPNLRYRGELVGEWGRTYSEGATSNRDDICAWAANFQLEYLFRECRMRPRVSAEYIFASGDKDRRLSATSTVGGNEFGTNDNAFNAFGFRDTGIAFAPRMSNLHIYNVGASFFPLEKCRGFEKMEVGTKAFFYHKATRGPISDTTADNMDSTWVGWEWDVYCDWRITSDLSWSIRYGVFRPGAAFSNQDCRQFLFSGVTFSF